MSKATRNGYIFESEVERGLALAGFDFYKIPDGKSLGRVIPMKVPCDFLLSWQKKLLTLEAKQTSLKRIPWRNFKTHQLEWVLKNPESAFFVIDFKEGRDHTIYIMTAACLELAMDLFDSSVPKDFFEHNAVLLERKTGKHNSLNTGAFVEMEKFRQMLDGK
jgi:penicillin-binding protein-related factor A (putative recombinase)